MSPAAKQTASALEKARAAWKTLPDWVEVLAGAVDGEGSTGDVASRIGYSPSSISGVINRSYTGRLVHIETAVRQTLMRGSVSCPVMGIITGERCNKAQREKLVPTNPIKVRLYKACRNGCPNARSAGEPS
ncbi:transcriptional regulator [Algimonas porphyrae]|uniref:Transcriptional regulator n=1 Tax=Algimonas porphyrae TaxID=1128113 RepID=A0ABQ5V1B5_9PROT|nr:hypothetical protein [Algimonas porphyrae]GLQ20474.1 hypothetical protein GCM10007854_14290 [Algimonas porphyrae]